MANMKCGYAILLIWLCIPSGCGPRYKVDRSASPILHRSRSQSQPSRLPGWGPVKQEIGTPAEADKKPASAEHQANLTISLDEVEHAIDRFQNQRRGSGPAADSAWPPFIETLELYLKQAPERLSLSPLIRARVAADYELDRERRRPVGMSQEFERVVIHLLVRIDTKMRALRTLAATSLPKGPAASKNALEWPVTRGVITSGFGTRRDPIVPTRMRFHSGIDLSAPLHEPIYAAKSGRVILAGWSGGAGRAVRIRHSDGSETLYGHLAMIMVKTAQLVKGGDVIGLLGMSGRATGPHLHFAVFIGGKAVDPLEHLREVPMSFSDAMPGVVFGYGN